MHAVRQYNRFAETGEACVYSVCQAGHKNKIFTYSYCMVAVNQSLSFEREGCAERNLGSISEPIQHAFLSKIPIHGL